MIEGAYITTYTGKVLSLLDPQPEEIDVTDIAWALACECRFAGHTYHPYTVGHHSLLASQYSPTGYQLEALLHDSTEAYLKDIPSPLKRLLPEYVEIENRLDRVIRDTFGLPAEMSAAVKEVDLKLLATEKRDLLPNAHEDWAMLEGVEAYVAPISIALCDAKPSLRRDLFMRRYEELFL